MPTASTTMYSMSRRVTRSRSNSGASTRMNSGFVAWMKIALAAVVSLFAKMKHTPAVAYPMPT
jgi:hypothetical protein